MKIRNFLRDHFVPACVWLVSVDWCRKIGSLAHKLGDKYPITYVAWWDGQRPLTAMLFGFAACIALGCAVVFVQHKLVGVNLLEPFPQTDPENAGEAENQKAERKSLSHDICAFFCWAASMVICSGAFAFAELAGSKFPIAALTANGHPTCLSTVILKTLCLVIIGYLEACCVMRFQKLE